MIDEVRYERVGAAAVLTIDRQHRRNAVDGLTAERLRDGLDAFEADDGARVMILTGAGDASFCAGADLKAIETYAGRLNDPDGPMGFTRRTPTKPTIAAIGGWALAGGLELALWCDLRIAAEGSTLGFPERRWGVPLVDGGTQRLPRVVGLGRALEMAEGLAQFPQETMLADRRAAIAGLGLPLAEGLALEAQAGPQVFADAVAGAARFAGGEGRGGAGAGV